MKARPAIAALAACALAAMMAAPAWAQSETADSSGVGSGQDAYYRHCAVCHGLEGYGNGPLADAMRIAPSDLTLLAAKHEGTFPAEKVSDVIRSGGAVLGHGSPTMPAWGLYFAEKGQPDVMRSRIKALVDYIASIQKK